MLRPSASFIQNLRDSLPASANERIEKAIRSVVKAKERGGRVVVVTGSGPNIHEGITTLIAGMIHKGLIDGVVTSSAVIAHEMAGTLDRVMRIGVGPEDGLPIAADLLPRGNVFELTLLSPDQRARIQTEMPTGWELYDRLFPRGGNTVIKAAGNMAWPMGVRTERLAREIRDVRGTF